MLCTSVSGRVEHTSCKTTGSSWSSSQGSSHTHPGARTEYTAGSGPCSYTWYVTDDIEKNINIFRLMEYIYCIGSGFSKILSYLLSASRGFPSALAPFGTAWGDEGKYRWEHGWTWYDSDLLTVLACGGFSCLCRRGLFRLWGYTLPLWMRLLRRSSTGGTRGRSIICTWGPGHDHNSEYGHDDS